MEYAAHFGDVARVRWLLKRDPYLNTMNYACVLASRKGHVEVIRVLLEEGASTTAKRADGSFALHNASDFGHVEVVHVLLAAGADKNAVATMAKSQTPLHFAAIDGHVDVIRVLLTAGADASLVNSDGKTARQLLVDKHPKLAWPVPRHPTLSWPT